MVTNTVDFEFCYCYQRTSTTKLPMRVKSLCCRLAAATALHYQPLSATSHIRQYCRHDVGRHHADDTATTRQRHGDDTPPHYADAANRTANVVSSETKRRSQEQSLDRVTGHGNHARGGSTK